MSLFDDLVEAALRHRPEVAILRPVVEKEILHHEILRIMNQADLLRNLVFMGGTCLRLCHGSPRLSEDLDFATALADAELTSELVQLGVILPEKLHEKYDLPVVVDAPERTEGDVRTWKVRITTRPGRRDLPLQRINIDVQTLSALDPVPMALRNPYRVDLGTMGLIIATESMSEILVDKVIAIALRPNRIKNRDLWDLGWLDQHDVPLRTDVLETKLSNRGIAVEAFRDLYATRCAELDGGHDRFVFEMRRFLAPQLAEQSISRPEYYEYLVRTAKILLRRM